MQQLMHLKSEIAAKSNKKDLALVRDEYDRFDLLEAELSDLVATQLKRTASPAAIRFDSKCHCIVLVVANQAGLCLIDYLGESDDYDDIASSC